MLTRVSIDLVLLYICLLVGVDCCLAGCSDAHHQGAVNILHFCLRDKAAFSQLRLINTSSRFNSPSSLVRQVIYYRWDNPLCLSSTKPGAHASTRSAGVMQKPCRNFSNNSLCVVPRESSWSTSFTAWSTPEFDVTKGVSAGWIRHPFRRHGSFDFPRHDHAALTFAHLMPRL